MKEKQFVISETILNTILRYLGTKPYAEVAAGIDALMKLPELPAAEEATAE